MRNNKGSISILIMVIGALLIFIFLLGTLLVNSSRLTGHFNDVYSYGNVYAEQRGLENSMYFILVESFLNNYQKVLKENSENIGSEDLSLNNIFIESVSGMRVEDAKDKGIVFIFDHSYTSVDNQIIDFLKDGIPILSFNGESVNVLVENWKLNEKKLDGDGNAFLNVDYSSNLSVNVSFGMLGLSSFESINKIYCECVGAASVGLAESCFKEKFSNFDVSSNIDSSEQPSKVRVGLISKDEYYIEKKMDRISFNLIFDYFEEGKASKSSSFCPTVNSNGGSILITR